MEQKINPICGGGVVLDVGEATDFITTDKDWEMLGQSLIAPSLISMEEDYSDESESEEERVHGDPALPATATAWEHPSVRSAAPTTPVPEVPSPHTSPGYAATAHALHSYTHTAEDEEVQDTETEICDDDDDRKPAARPMSQIDEVQIGSEEEDILMDGIEVPIPGLGVVHNHPSGDPFPNPFEFDTNDAVGPAHEYDDPDPDWSPETQEPMARRLPLVYRLGDSPVRTEPSPEELSAAKTPRARSAIETWYQRFSELVAFQRVNGHCNVPQKFDGNKQLGIWVNKQRMEKKFMDEGGRTSMTFERAQLLEKIGFTWAKRKGEHSWLKKFRELEEYHRRHGTADVPTKFAENPALGRWVSTQRSEYKKFQSGTSRIMTQPHIDRLNGLGFRWELIPSRNPDSVSGSNRSSLSSAASSSNSTITEGESPRGRSTRRRRSKKQV